MTLSDCGAKRAVDAQADHDEESRFNQQRNHVPGHIFSVGKGRSGAVDGVTPAPPRHSCEGRNLNAHCYK